MKPSKWTVLSFLLGGAGLVISFIAEGMGAKGAKEDLIAELQEDYVLVPKIKDDQEEE